MVRLAAGAQMARGAFVHELSARADLEGKRRYSGSPSFDPGRLFSARWGSRWAAPQGWDLRALLVLAARTGGEIGSGSPFDSSAVGAGTIGSWQIACARRLSGWRMEVSIGGTQVRSFPGELGHAGWLTPGLAVSHALDGGTVRGSLALPSGQSRSGASLHGIAASLSWSGGIIQ